MHPTFLLILLVSSCCWSASLVRGNEEEMDQEGLGEGEEEDDQGTEMFTRSSRSPLDIQDGDEKIGPGGKSMKCVGEGIESPFFCLDRQSHNPVRLHALEEGQEDPRHRGEGQDFDQLHVRPQPNLLQKRQLHRFCLALQEPGSGHGIHPLLPHLPLPPERQGQAEEAGRPAGERHGGGRGAEGGSG